MNPLRLIFLIALGASISSTAHAGGRIVPIDERGHVRLIDPGLNRTLQLVDSLGPRGGAYLYELDDASHALVIWSQKDNRLVRSARPLSEPDVARLREAVTTHLREADPEYRLDRSGRGHLLRGVALLSAGFYGWAYPELRARERKEDHLYSNGVLGGIAAMTTFGVLVPAFITEFAPIPEGTARLGIWGGTRGILAGSLIYTAYIRDPHDEPLPGYWDDTPSWYSHDKNSQNELRTPLLTSLGGLAGGLAVGYATDIPAGDAALIGICGDAGFVGGAFADMARKNSSRFGQHSIRLSRTMLLGGATGVAAGAVLSQLQSYSVGDALIVRSTTTLGTLLPASIGIMAHWDTRTSESLCIGGLAAGVALGHYLTRDWDYTPTDGGLLEFALVGGGCVSLAWASILRPTFHPGHTLDHLGLPAFTLGATATSALAWRHLDYHRLHLARSQSWQFHLTPQLAIQDRETIPMLGAQVEF
jgi:hypothetical protein